MTLRIASHTSLRGSMQALNGSSNTYTQAMRKPMGHPMNQRPRNHKILQRMPGQRSAMIVWKVYAIVIRCRLDETMSILLMWTSRYVRGLS